MRRREFIALVGGAAAAWPLAVRAQQPGKPPTIGFLGADAAGWRPWTDAFVARLRELGWIDGQTIAIDYRWTEGHPERVAEIAAEFVRRKVDRHRHVRNCRPHIKAGDSGHPHRLCNWARPGRRRPRLKSGATRRQRYWIIVAGH